MAGTSIISDQTIRRRDVRLVMDWADVKRLLTAEAMRIAGLDESTTPTDVEVKLAQREEGSPSYRVSKWDASVSITVPLDDPS